MQNYVHADVLWFEPTCLIERHSALIAAPHIESHVVASLAAGVIEHCLVDRGADMGAAQGLVYAEVVDIQCFDVGQDVVV